MSRNLLSRLSSPLLALLAAGLLSVPQAQAQLAAPPPVIAARAWFLLDNVSGQALTENKPDERVEPASLTKLMTAYLAFAALRQGTLKLDQTVPVSERAWREPGSMSSCPLSGGRPRP